MDADERELAAVLAKQLRALRQERGWTQAVLAERAGVTPHYVALLETARKLPTLKTLGSLAKALGVAPGKLLDGGAPTADSWAAEVTQLASAIPEPSRLLVRDILKAVAKSRTDKPAAALKQPEQRAKRYRAKKTRGART